MVTIKCKSCGYVWDYTGNKEKATCPSCSIKNKVGENKAG